MGKKMNAEEERDFLSRHLLPSPNHQQIRRIEESLLSIPSNVSTDVTTTSSSSQTSKNLKQPPAIPKAIPFEMANDVFAPKLRRDRGDDIVEAAMRLMDLAMDQNRFIKRLQHKARELDRVCENNYTDKKEF